LLKQNIDFQKKHLFNYFLTEWTNPYISKIRHDYVRVYYWTSGL